MKVFHIVCMVLMIAMMQHTCLADEQTRYIINSSTNWANTSYNQTREQQATGYNILEWIPSDAVSHWTFDNNTFLDENVTSSNDGVNNGSAYNMTGKWGNARDFDGVDDSVCCGNDTTLQGSIFTVSLYAMFNDLYRQPLITEYYDVDNYDFEMSTGTGSTLFGIMRSGGSDENTGVHAISTGIWYHIVLTFEGTIFRLWVDGVNVQSKTDMSFSPSKTGTIYIGYNPNWHNIGARYFNGTIDDVRIYNRVLSQAEINQTRDNYHQLTGNVTHWQDVGAGYQGSQFKFVFGNDSNSFLEGWVSADNSTWYQVTNNVTNDTLMNIPAAYKNQTQYIRALLKGNGTLTPEEIEVWIVSESVGPGPIPTPTPAISVSPASYDELDFPLILYILMISLLYLLIAFRNGAATIELSLIYLIFAFIFLLFQTVTMSVNYIYLILFLLLFMISIAGITKQGVD